MSLFTPSLTPFVGVVFVLLRDFLPRVPRGLTISHCLHSGCVDHLGDCQFGTRKRADNHCQQGSHRHLNNNTPVYTEVLWGSIGVGDDPNGYGQGSGKMLDIALDFTIGPLQNSVSP